MKINALFLSLISSFLLLSSCSIKPTNDENSGEFTSETSSSSHSSEWLNGKSFSIFTLNDFHGSVEEKEGYQMGLKKMGSFFKRKGAEANTITLDQGDTWQGSIYSNFNHGQLVNDVMCEAKFDARTVGNHDFDWGADTVIRNTALTYNGYRIPALAANIYDYNFDTKTFGNTQQSQIGQPSTVITLENEVRIGVVGVIGSNQITSIQSEYMYDYGFKDHVAIAKQEATRLRNEENCDFVICSIHGDQDDLLGKGMSNYVDLVLCAHTHQKECTIEDDKLLYLQAGRNGEAYGEIHVSFKNGKPNSSYAIKTFRDYQSEFEIIDPAIDSLVDQYNAECSAEANKVVAQNVTGSFYSDGSLVNLMCKALIDKCEDEGMSDVIFSYCNYARCSLNKTTWTYGDIYEAFPFDNVVPIIEVTGKEIYNEVGKYNWICKSSSFDDEIDYTHKYKIACLDYIAFHTDSDRNYDWFPENAGKSTGALDTNYREILRNWLVDNHYSDGTYTLKASDYSSSVARHNKNSIDYTLPSYTITFDLNGGHVEDETQLVRVGDISTLYSTLYPNPNPTKDGYAFCGWYLNSTFTVSANNRYIDHNRTLYAKWDAPKVADNIIEPDEIDFSGSSFTLDIADSLTMNLFWDNALYNSTYNQIQLNNYGFFELNAPSGYNISHIHMSVYGTYDNLSFSVMSNPVSDEGFVSGPTSTYDFDMSGSILDISNRSGHVTYIISIEFTLESIS